MNIVICFPQKMRKYNIRLNIKYAKYKGALDFALSRTFYMKYRPNYCFNAIFLLLISNV